MKKYIITKKIAKHGKQAIIVIPEVLSQKVKPGNIAQITIEILDRDDEIKDEGDKNASS